MHAFPALDGHAWVDVEAKGKERAVLALMGRT